MKYIYVPKRKRNLVCQIRKFSNSWQSSRYFISMRSLIFGIEPQRIKTTNSSKFKDYLNFIHKSCFIKNYRYSNSSRTNGHLGYLFYTSAIIYTTAFSQKLVLRILAKRFEFYMYNSKYLVKIKFGCGFYPWCKNPSL